MRFVNIQCPPRTPLGELTGGGGREGRGRERRGRERGERVRKGGEGEERLTLMRCWNRAADWLRPALKLVVSSTERRISCVRQ